MGSYDDDNKVIFNKQGELVFAGKTISKTILNSISAEDTKNYLESVGRWHKEVKRGNKYYISHPFSSIEEKTPSTVINEDGSIKIFNDSDRPLMKLTNIMMEVEGIGYREALNNIIERVSLPYGVQNIIDLAKQEAGLNKEDLSIIRKKQEEARKLLQKEYQESLIKQEKYSEPSRKIKEVKSLKDPNLKKYAQKKGIDLLQDLREVKYLYEKDGVEKTSWQKIGFPNIYAQARIYKIDLKIENLAKKVGFELRGVDKNGIPNDKSAAGHKSISFIKGREETGKLVIFESFTSAGAAIKLSALASDNNPIPINDVIILNSISQKNLFITMIKLLQHKNDSQLTKEELSYKKAAEEINNITAALGSKQNYDEIYLFLDQDKAGRTATQSIKDSLSNIIKVEDVSYHAGRYKDTSDLYEAIANRGELENLKIDSYQPTKGCSLNRNSLSKTPSPSM